MHRYPFIFSNDTKYRFSRHFVFWTSWWIFQSLLYGFTPVLLPLPEWKRFLISSVEALFYLIPHIFMAYSLLYFVIPKYLVKGRYMASTLAVILICIVTGLISSFISVFVLENIRSQIIPAWSGLLVKYNFTSIWLSLLAGLRGGITIGGMAAAIKLMKYWYLKEQRNLQLQKENSESRLQLLKAQVHPHFLFNTLNNIYSHTQGVAPVASQLVMGLSDMLRYMLYECRQDLVPLSRELEMMKGYALLENIRYGNRLEVNLDLPDNADDVMIAPLLLLPFLENSFKHGASNVIDQPWISLFVSVDDGQLNMKLINNKAAAGQQPLPASGIGISNVRKRLELIYAGKYKLDIINEEDVFIVSLQLKIERIPTIKEKRSQFVAQAYA